MSEVNVRSLALDIVEDVVDKGIFLHVELKRALNKYAYLERNEKAFMVRLSSGTIERMITIDAVINHFSKTKTAKMKPFIRNLLRISTYQIMYMSSVPDSAVCNEAVKLAKKRHFDNLSGFVNGVLRAIARGYKDVVLTRAQSFSVSDELYEMFREQYPDDYEYILSEFLEDRHDTVIRFNKSRVDDDRLREIVKAHNLKTVCEEMGIYSLTGGEGIEELEGFNEGLFVVQDSAAALCVYLSEPKPYMNVLDMCAAPGGKSIQAMDMMGNGSVTSRDISEAKLLMIEEAAERCGFNDINCELSDAQEYSPSDKQKYDIVLTDVPCSGLGIIANKPDIKNNFNLAGTHELIELSKKIVTNACQYVKPGGILAFSTCTLNRRENEDIVRYIEGLPVSLEPIDITDKLPDCFTKYIYDNYNLTVLPVKGVCEGFFVRLFRVRG